VHGPGAGAKKGEVKWATTDFKPVDIEIKQLGWSRGVIPSSQKANPQKVDLAVEPSRESPVLSKPRQMRGSSLRKTSLSPLRISMVMHFEWTNRKARV